MHYDRTAFGSGRETIRPKQAGVTELGNREGPTKIDIRQMNLLYKCGGGGGGGTTSAPGVTTAGPTAGPTAEPTKPPVGCVDTDKRCRYWTSYCSNNDYVKKNCKKTCGLPPCSGGGCKLNLTVSIKTTGVLDGVATV